MRDINSYFNIENHSIRKLDICSVKEIQSLCERCSDYFIMEQEQEASIDEGREILEALPQYKEMKDKFALGIYNVDDTLIGLIDIIKGYPTEQEWMLGLMLIDPSERNRGLGRLIHQGLIHMVKSQGGEKIRIGVLEDNKKAIKFWQKIGYRLIKKSTLQRKGKPDKEISVFSLNVR